MKELNVRGFKTDGGEFLFDDSTRLHNGQTEKRHIYLSRAVHSGLPRIHAPTGYPASYILRAGYIGAQTQPIHWAGDQLSEWSELRAQLRAGLSAGLSGIPFGALILAVLQGFQSRVVLAFHGHGSFLSRDAVAR